MKDYYSSFRGFPLAGATLPVMAVLLLGIYSENVIVICSAIILGMVILEYITCISKRLSGIWTSL